jgi:hypothetical protein
MTAIAGFVDANKTVWIGGDSAGVSGASITVRADAKVFQRGQFLFGFTSSFRMGQLLRYKLEIPTRADGQDVEEYLATSFADSVRQCLKDGGYARKTNEEESGGTFLLGYAGRLFCIQSDYQIGESLHGYDACGCGDDIAIGALYSTQDLGGSHGRMMGVLQAVERHCSAVCGPFVIKSLPLAS